MSLPPEVSRRFGPGFGQRVRRYLQISRRRLGARHWFPHIPLFVAVAALGAEQMRHALFVGMQLRSGIQWDRNDLLLASGDVITSVRHGGPSAITGVFLFAMAFGLLTRSRVAWAIALLGSAVSFMLILLVWHVPAGRPVGLLAYSAALLIALIACRSRFNRSSLASATLFAAVSIASLVAYAVFGSYLLGAQFNPPIKDVPTALYYGVVTMCTVGYGDIVPETTEARMFAISVMVLGITVFAASVSALLVPLVNRQVESLLAGREKTMPRSNHYVITSDSSLARNTHKELTIRDLPVTLILTHAPEPSTGEHDIVLGDASDLDVLRRAGVDQAKAILALSQDNSENAFVVMAVRELSDAIKTVAAVNDARNMDRVKRARPDLIIAPQVLGGELLAMALSGEKVDNEQLMRQLLHFAA